MNAPTRFPIGSLAYLDSFGGLIPCKVTGVDANGQVQARVTALRGAYSPGDLSQWMSQRHIIPRSHVRRFRGQYMIMSRYYVWVPA